MKDTGPVAAALDEIRERAGYAKEYMQGDPMPSSLDDVPRLLAAVEAALNLTARWQSFGDGEDAQSECANELREAITAALSGPATAEDAVAASIEQQSAYRNELRHLPGYMDGEGT